MQTYSVEPIRNHIAAGQGLLNFLSVCCSSATSDAEVLAINPSAYLTDVISKIVNGHPNSRIDELLPWAYPSAHPLKHVA